MEDSKNKDFIREFYLDSGFATRALHAGEHVGQPETGSHTNPIYQTSTFVFQNAQEGADIFSGTKPGYVYTRLGNPTVRLLEAKINALEGAAYKIAHPDSCVSSLAFSSGMAAVSATFLAACSHGDTVVVGDLVYGATEHLCSNVLNRMGIRSVEVNMSDLSRVESALRAHPKAKLVFLETPANPTLKLADIREIARIARSVNPDIHV